MILGLAWKNLWRNRRRTLVTATAVAFGIWLSASMHGLNTYAYGLLIAGSARMGPGHVSVQAKGYQEAPSLKLRLAGAEAMAGELRKRPGVAAALPRIQGAAMLSTASRSVGGAFIALDPSLEGPSTHPLLKGLVEGQAFQGRADKLALVGDRLAKRLGLKLGRKLVLTCNDAHGQMTTALFRVGGIFRSGAEEIDNSLVILPLQSAAQMLGYAPGEAGSVALLLEDQRGAEAAAPALDRDLGRPDAEVLPWQETLPELAGMMRVDGAFNIFFELVLGLVIAVGVLNTALMSMLERRREMGVMLALGLAPRRLFALMLAESAWVGGLGMVLGAAVTVPWYYWLRRVGLDMSGFLPEDGVAMGGVMLDPIYRAQLFPSQVAGIVAAALLLSLLAGAFPAWKAARLPPVESIRDL